MKAGFHRVIRRRIALGAAGRKPVVQFSNSTGEGNLMKCHRCNGMMVYEKFYGDSENFFGWRCIACGEIVDQVILENRFLSI